MPTTITLCEIHGGRCGHLKCECRRPGCVDCIHYRQYSGFFPLSLEVNRVVKATAPPATGLLPEKS